MKGWDRGISSLHIAPALWPGFKCCDALRSAARAVTVTWGEARRTESSGNGARSTGCAVTALILRFIGEYCRYSLPQGPSPTAGETGDADAATALLPVPYFTILYSFQFPDSFFHPFPRTSYPPTPPPANNPLYLQLLLPLQPKTVLVASDSTNHSNACC